MGKNYVYRMDHDTGFAPNTSFGICSLTGCKNSNGKRKNIEESAERGSWVIGIGGNNTGKPNKLIYAMEVEKNLQINKFKKDYPCKSKYLKGRKPGTNVLVSCKFYYFGDNAIEVPKGLEENIIISTQGCKIVSDEDIKKLKRYLSKKYEYGVHGKPNNSETKGKCKKC